jgi:hypothetical protein
MDRGFIGLLLMISITGLALLALRHTQYMGLLLALHLGFVMGFFGDDALRQICTRILSNRFFTQKRCRSSLG